MVSYLLHKFRHGPALAIAIDPRCQMKKFLLICALFLTPFACRVEAAVDLYQGEVAVADQGSAERDRALPKALEHVPRKLSGLRQFDDYPEVQPALARAPELVLSYYYRRVLSTLPDGSEAEELRLVARFAETAVDEMARELQLPLWQPQRRPLLAWLIVDNGLDRRIMPVEFDYTRQSMEAVGEQRGLPLEWPSPDAEGAYAVDEQILWGGYTEDLMAAQGAGVLIAAARREGPEWGVRINLGYQGQHWSWRLSDLDLQAALVAGTEQAIDQIATVNTIVASDLGSWQQELTVTGLRDAGSYGRCLRYLQSMSLVDGVAVVAAQPGAVTFRLSLNALPRYLEEAFDSGSVLKRTDTEGNYVLVEATPDDS